MSLDIKYETKVEYSEPPKIYSSSDLIDRKAPPGYYVSREGNIVLVPDSCHDESPLLPIILTNGKHIPMELPLLFDKWAPMPVGTKITITITPWL